MKQRNKLKKEKKKYLKGAKEIKIKAEDEEDKKKKRYTWELY